MEISSAIFYSNWYEGSYEYRRLIIFFIMRTKTPCEYQAYGYTALSMETYMRVMLMVVKILHYIKIISLTDFEVILSAVHIFSRR